MRTTLRGQNGFTIIEVIVAIAIFMFGISALLGLFHVGGNFEQKARVHSELTPAIEPLIEYLQDNAFRYDALSDTYQLNTFIDQPVPGTSNYKYELWAVPSSNDPNVFQGQLRFYRKSPDKVVVRVPFVLLRQVPIISQVTSND